MESCQPVWLNQVPTASSKICTSRLYVFICHRGSLPHSSPIQSPSLPLPTPPSGPSFPPSPSTHYGNGRARAHAAAVAEEQLLKPEEAPANESDLAKAK